MAVELRLPNINGMTEKEQLVQIRSYLYQFIPQLQWALNNLTTTSSTTTVTPTQNQVVVSGGSSAPAPETTFNAIKSLIIKSADIVDAYYDVISKKLEGLYVAESVFGTYTEETSQQITTTSTNIIQAFEDIQTISSNLNSARDSIDSVTGSIEGVKGDVASARGDIDSAIADIDAVKGDINNANSGIEGLREDLETWRKETKAYITTGQVDTADDGTPIYGVEIGQTDIDSGQVVDRFARFTADRLEFYHKSEYPVAYISGYKLYITNAEILGNLKLGNDPSGKYEFDTSNGLILKWVEGE